VTVKLASKYTVMLLVVALLLSVCANPLCQSVVLFVLQNDIII
jgi:hypothetical protein